VHACSCAQIFIDSFWDFLIFFAYFQDSRWLKSETFLTFGQKSLAEHLLLSGDFAAAREYAGKSLAPEAGGLIGVISFIQGRHKTALKEFRQVQKNLRRHRNRKYDGCANIADFFFLVALLGSAEPVDIAEAQALVEASQRSNRSLAGIVQIMVDLFAARTSGKTSGRISFEAVKAAQTPLYKWLLLHAVVWLAGLDQVLVPALNQVIEKSMVAGFRLPLYEALTLKQELQCNIGLTEKQGLELWRQQGNISLAHLLEPRPQWEIIIEALRKTVVPEPAVNQSDKMLIWELALTADGQKLQSFELVAREKTRLKSGRWSSGKIVELNRGSVDNQDFPEFYTPQDCQLCTVLGSTKGSYFYMHDPESWQIFPLLVNHPQVFLRDNDAVAVQIVRGEPIMVFEESDKLFKLGFQPGFSGEKVVVMQESGNILRVYEFSELQIKAGTILNPDCLFPRAAREKIIDAVTLLAGKMPVHSTVDGVEQLTPIETVSGDVEPCVMLAPEGPGLRVKICVRPFSVHGPAFRPGQGLHDVYAEIDGQKVHTRRDFGREIDRLRQLFMQVPMLASVSEDGCEAVVADPQDALELLLQLGEAGDVRMEWPADKKIRRVRSVAGGNLRLKITGNQDWFTVNGELRVDDEMVVGIQQLLESFARSDGRFVELNGQFIALTEEFRR
jgi:hypothetical protein